MAGIRLYDTRTRTKQDFTPIDPDDVRLYVCGPTVYDRAHLGNARPVVVFDVLYRLLRHTYGADHVTYVRNFTDVDDKINARAREMQAAGDARPMNEIIRALTDETIGWYHKDMDALGALRPRSGPHPKMNCEPRATEYIGQMVAMIGGLEADGFAYARDGHVLFRVRKYADYGKLSGRSLDDMIAGARVEVAPYKEDPMDFVLWKPATPEEPGWDSPWGRGRPGWHIECSAMAKELLGTAFDIHGGGIDLQFPHHENEIAQSCCADPGAGFANVWMHNEMVQVEGKKMSKSLGNFFTVRDLLDQGVPGEVIRFVLLSTHYRKPMDWSEEKARLAKWKLAQLHDVVLRAIPDVEPHPEDVDPTIIEALAQDLNTHEAIRHLEGISLFADDSAHPKHLEAAQRLADSLASLGLFNRDLVGTGGPFVDPEKWKSLAQRLTELREQAKARKDFSEVDRFKETMRTAGVEVRMSKAEVELVPGPDFDPAKLEALK